MMATLVVRDYDEAIDFDTRVMRLRLVEDKPMSATKRWIVVRPGAEGCDLLLAQDAPRDEPYGRVIVFHDLYGNKGDLVQPVTGPQARPRSLPPEGAAAGLGAARRPA